MTTDHEDEINRCDRDFRLILQDVETFSIPTEDGESNYPHLAPIYEACKGNEQAMLTEFYPACRTEAIRKLREQGRYDEQTIHAAIFE